MYTRRDVLKAAGLSFAGLGLSLSPISKSFGAGPKKNPPNIIFILSDDQGWTGTSVAMDPNNPESKSDYYETPNLERLARQGMRFSNAYSPAAICCPSRCAIQYGKSPSRLLFMSNDFEKGHWHPDSQKRITESISLPKMLKQTDQGYVTAHLGKWHHWPHPDEVGYDVNTGATNNGTGNFLKAANKKTGEPAIPFPPDDPKRIFSLSRKACQFMNQQVKNKKPFYLQISHYAAHATHMSRPETRAKYEKKAIGKWHRRPVFGSMIEDLDTGIGIVLDKIEALGIEDNTYVFYMADNGTVTKGKRGSNVNMPLRRGKYVFMDGGVRVPMFAAGPGIEKNSHSKEIVWGCDLWPTIHDLTGAKDSLPKDLDGGSMVSLFKAGGKGEVQRNGMPEGLVFHCADGVDGQAIRRQSAIRSGDFKLLKHYYNPGEVLLFNVKDDIYEWHDLSKKMPEKRDELLNKMEGYLKRVNAIDGSMTPKEIADMKDSKTVFPINSFSPQEKNPKPYGTK